MKKLLLLILVTLSMNSAFSQNFQIHYDFGKANDTNAQDRKHITTTLEYFKPDNYGSTFLFVDFDYNSNDKGVSLSYMEISRNIKISSKTAIQAHIEYNGGHIGSDNFGLSFNNAFIVGGAYNLKITKDFTLATMLGYKYIQNTKNGADIQMTVSWFKPLGKKFLLTGFLDIWSQDKFGQKGKNVVFLAEPQIWYTLNKTFKIGGELEISKNFIANSKKLEIMPTLGIRWQL